MKYQNDEDKREGSDAIDDLVVCDEAVTVSNRDVVV